MLEEKTGVPVLGVVPYTRADIDDEDSLAPCLAQTQQRRPLDIAVVRLPRISNFTDFSPLESHPALGVRYVERAGQLGEPDLLVLPGTKNTMGDLAWMRQNGLEAAVKKLAAAGTPVRACAAATRCWERRWTTRTAWSREAAWTAWAFCPARRALPGRRCAPVCRRAPPQARCGRAAGRLRDPYGPHRTRRHAAVLPACGRHARGRGGRQCVRPYLHGLFDTGELTESWPPGCWRARGFRPRTCARKAMPRTRSVSTTCWRTRCAPPLILLRCTAQWTPARPSNTEEMRA